MTPQEKTHTFRCISRNPLLYSYRSVRLEPVKSIALADITLSEVRTIKFKLKQYAPNNRIKSHTFENLEACATYIDNLLDNSAIDENGNSIKWTVHQERLAWYTSPTSV
jgi:hypothetical protein